jgi:hypothetical protein
MRSVRNLASSYGVWAERAASTPRFATGAPVETAFGTGIILRSRCYIGRSGLSHWRYSIRLNDGALIDAAEPGVRRRD